MYLTHCIILSAQRSDRVHGGKEEGRLVTRTWGCRIVAIPSVLPFCKFAPSPLLCPPPPVGPPLPPHSRSHPNVRTTTAHHHAPPTHHHPCYHYLQLVQIHASRAPGLWGEREAQRIPVSRAPVLWGERAGRRPPPPRFQRSVRPAWHSLWTRKRWRLLPRVGVRLVGRSCARRRGRWQLSKSRNCLRSRN